MKNLSWYLSLAITFTGFTIINYFFTIEKGEELGNFNPAFIPMVILVPFLLLSLFITVHIGASYFHNATIGKTILAIVLIVLIFVLAGATEYKYVVDQLDAFGGSWNDSSSILYNLSPFNGYTNDWYFNESVFLLLHALAFSLGSLLKKPVVEEQQEK